MNWVEYKLENDSVIKVPYNRCNVAPVTKEVLEQLIKVVNASMRQAKILEHIKTNYADRMREQYEQGRADAIDECMQIVKDYSSAMVGTYYYNLFIDKMEKLKEQKKEEMGLLEEHHKICKKCWSGQDKVVGRRCSGCINHNEYEPI